MGDEGKSIEQLIEELRAARRQIDELEENQEKFRVLTETSSVAFFMLQEDRFTYVNPAFLGLTGYSWEDLREKTIWDLLHPDSIPQVEERRQKMLRTGFSSGHSEMAYVTRWGELRWAVANGGIVDFHGTQTWLLTAYDITDQRNVEQQLEQERSHLAQRVEERTSELMAANADLARAARLKDEFLSNMSHELRTPLNTILGMTQALLAGVQGALADPMRQSISHIAESGQRLLTVINDILDIARFDAGKMGLETSAVNVPSLCEASVRIVRQEAKKKGLALDSRVDERLASVLLWADQRKLKQALVNLLSNAVKFTPAEGSVGLDVTLDPEVGALHFCVWDTGVGIAAEQMERLFKPFSQADGSLTRAHEGAGLGLALVQRLVELHEGGIRVESALGQGSRFVVSIPWRVAPAPAAPAAAAEVDLWNVHVSDALTATQVLWEAGADVQHEWIPGGEVPDLVLFDPAASPIELHGLWQALRIEEALRGKPMLACVPVEWGEALLPGVHAVSRLPTGEDLVGILERAVGEKLAGRRILVATMAHEMGWRSPTVLLASAQETYGNALAHSLEEAGYRVLLARNGQEAVVEALEIAPATIVLRKQLPTVDGLEALRRMRRHPELEHTPAILLTALHLPGDDQRCQEAGASRLLDWPVSAGYLTSVIESLRQGYAALPAQTASDGRES